MNVLYFVEVKKVCIVVYSFRSRVQAIKVDINVVKVDFRNVKDLKGIFVEDVHHKLEPVKRIVGDAEKNFRKNTKVLKVISNVRNRLIAEKATNLNLIQVAVSKNFHKV